jgi:hypothetical protein
VGEVKMSRDEVKAIVRDSTLFGWSNTWLDNYYHQLQTVQPTTHSQTVKVAG